MLQPALSRLKERLASARSSGPVPGLATSWRAVPRLVRAKEVYDRWITAVAETVTAGFSSLSSARLIRLVEKEGGELLIEDDVRFPNSPLQGKQLTLADDRLENTGGPLSETALNGCDVELVLRPERFLLQSLDLPARAAEFLDGVVRSQIDRLTPWHAEQAAYGWSDPVREEDDRISLVIAAAPKSSLFPYVEALAGYGARSISVHTADFDDDNETRIGVVSKQASKTLNPKRIRPILNGALLSMTLVTVLSILASVLVSNYVHTRQEEIASKLGHARGKMVSESDRNLTLLQTLEQRKYDIAPTVIVIESISRILPDDAYVTTLQVDGNKVRITGIARNAPNLIELMERSTYFARATFFAPTTRSPSDPGERFHIEALIQPVTINSSI